MNKMREKELIYKLIYQVLIEIREEATLRDNKKILCLSDLMHNIPLRLLKAENGNDYEGLLKDVTERAESIGMASWLKNALSQL